MVVDIAMWETKGEIFKLSNYYQKASKAGFAGAIIVIIIYGFMFILNLFILYNYIIFHHFDGWLQDIYVRLIGYKKAFFIPNDNEMSWKHVWWAYFTAKFSNYRIIVNQFKVYDPKNKEWIATCMQISKYDTRYSLKHWRTFFKDDIGRIMEINQEEISKQSAIHYNKLDELIDRVSTVKG